MFGGKDMDPYEVWSLVSFHVPLWALVSKLFWETFYLVGTPSFRWGGLVGLFFVCSCILSFLSMKAVVLIKKKRRN